MDFLSGPHAALPQSSGATAAKKRAAAAKEEAKAAGGKKKRPSSAKGAWVGAVDKTVEGEKFYKKAKVGRWHLFERGWAALAVERGF